jgi:hypothetical protein
MNVSELLLSLLPAPFPPLAPAAATEVASDRDTVLETFCRPTSIT